MRYPVSIALIIIAAVIFTGCMNSTPDDARALPASGSGEVQVDALLPLSGVGSSLGESSEAALLTAEDDINRYYRELGSPTRVHVVIHDTGSDPATALSLAEQVRSGGSKVIIGYLGSAELSRIKDYTDSHGMIAISSGSTVPELAIPDDSIYRMISDDTAQGKFMAAYIDSENVDAVIPVWRGDVWGDSLSDLTLSAFRVRGGTPLEGVRYNPDTTDFNATVTSLDVFAGDAIAHYGADHVGIYAVSFNEIGDIMNQAAEKPNLSHIRWFGSDGNTLDPSLTGTSPAARFAASVNMTGMMWGIPVENQESPEVTRMKERLKREPDGSSIALYDTLWVVMGVMEETPVNASQAQRARALVRHLDTYRGVSSDMTVNDAGDRMLAPYDIIKVIPGPSGSEWKKVAQIRMWPHTSREEIIGYPLS